MASRGSKAGALLIFLNIIFVTCVSSNKVLCPPPSPSSVPAVPTNPANCPRDTLKFGVCGEWLGLVTEVVGTKPSSECCSLLTGLADLEAALCLCTAIGANVLGVIKVNIPIALSLLINGCGMKVPEGFVCA